MSSPKVADALCFQVVVRTSRRLFGPRHNYTTVGNNLL